MYLISIVPVNKIDWALKDSMLMILAHLVEKYPEYRNKIKNRKNNQYIILDNSTIELGTAFSMDRLYKAAKAINADEIILEDFYPEGPKTIEATKKSIQWLKDNNHLGEFKLQAVCHGRNREEFIETFNYLNSVPEIDVIGIPKVLATWAKERKELADIFTKTDKEIHYLGSWYSLKELLNLPKKILSKIRSCDTCLPSLYVIQNKSVLENREGTIDLEKDYPELTKQRYDEKLEEFKQEFLKAYAPLSSQERI